MEHIDIEAGVFRPTAPGTFVNQLVWKRAGRMSVRNSLAVAEAIRRQEQLLRCFFHIGDLSVDHTWGYRSATIPRPAWRWQRGWPTTLHRS